MIFWNFLSRNRFGEIFLPRNSPAGCLVGVVCASGTGGRAGERRNSEKAGGREEVAHISLAKHCLFPSASFQKVTVNEINPLSLSVLRICVLNEALCDDRILAGYRQNVLPNVISSFYLTIQMRLFHTSTNLSLKNTLIIIRICQRQCTQIFKKTIPFKFQITIIMETFIEELSTISMSNTNLMSPQTSKHPLSFGVPFVLVAPQNLPL